MKSIILYSLFALRWKKKEVPKNLQDHLNLSTTLESSLDLRLCLDNPENLPASTRKPLSTDQNQLAAELSPRRVTTPNTFDILIPKLTLKTASTLALALPKSEV